MDICKILFSAATFLFIVSGCKQHQRLPFLGNPIINGKDTSYPIVSSFSLTDQDSQVITNQTMAGKIYVADFIFLSCPGICPKMTREMYNAYLAFATDDRVVFISHSIDPDRDSVSRLKSFANNLGVKTSKWHFLTGNRDSIFKLADQSYFATAYPDSTAPGGFTHSGGFLLIDKNRHIRGVYNGTNPEETKRLINDIQILLKEEF